ncbi:MAG: class I SAM-dependent methyltransferase [Acidimicrobiales bacterium]
MRGRADTAQDDRERQEVRFWSESPTERPGAASLDVLTLKMAEARVLLEKFARFERELASATTILELGGGQCWVSCLVKRQFGEGRTVIGSDIAPGAVASVPEWERVLDVSLDGALACRSYEVPVRSGGVDLVLVFAAAHHFGAHRRTLAELARVLAPGGRILYLHEPGCRLYLHRAARRRVNNKRPVVPEDVLVYRRIAALGRAAGLSVELEFAPTLTARGAVETLYYGVLRRFPKLQHLLPCTVDLVITKPG